MKRKLAVPPGMKDILPGEARQRREITGRLMDLFARHGYQEVATSALEYYEVVERDGMDPSQVFRVLDREGGTLALRPDLTAPIARMVATRLRERPLPLRLCYTGNTFRYETLQTGRQREFTQAGVERIGPGGPVADLEVLCLAVDALETAGLADFAIGVGDVRVTDGLLRSFLPPDAVEEARERVAGKDFVALRGLLGDLGSGPAARRLGDLLARNGGPEMLEAAGELLEDPEGTAALDGLRTIAGALDRCGLAHRVFFDFGILRSFAYYTGMVFEGFAPGVGHPLCGGGRYDRLLTSFGFPAPAVGFALGLERLLLALGGDCAPLSGEVLVTGRDPGSVLAKARELRAGGAAAVLDLETEDLAAAQERARCLGIERIYVVENDDE